MSSNVVKLIITLVLMAVWSFICLVLFVMFAFGGEGFYVVTVVFLYFLLLAMIPLALFKAFRRRTRGIMWLSILGALAVAITVRESVRAYHNSFERIYESHVDLTRYKPFEEGTLAVSLDSPSTLTLTDSLPRMDGATAFYPVYAAFAQAVYPPKNYSLYGSEVECRTTSYAYNALIYGSADIIFVLKPSEEQLENAAQNDVEMVLTPIGREAFVFFVNAENPVSDLTTTQLRSIYSGQTKNWKQLGGKSGKIRAFQREHGSGSQTAFVDFMEGTDIMRPPQNDVVHGMGPIIERTASYTNYPNAIGFTFLYYAESMVGNDGIKLLSVDGVYPTKKTIRSGEYPLIAEFYAVTRADESNPNVELLLDWVVSEQGQYIIEKTGYNPISRKIRLPFE